MRYVGMCMRMLGIIVKSNYDLSNYLEACNCNYLIQDVEKNFDYRSEL